MGFFACSASTPSVFRYTRGIIQGYIMIIYSAVDFIKRRAVIMLVLALATGAASASPLADELKFVPDARVYGYLTLKEVRGFLKEHQIAEDRAAQILRSTLLWPKAPLFESFDEIVYSFDLKNTFTFFVTYKDKERAKKALADFRQEEKGGVMVYLISYRWWAIYTDKFMVISNGSDEYINESLKLRAQPPAESEQLQYFKNQLKNSLAYIYFPGFGKAVSDQFLEEKKGKLSQVLKNRYLEAFFKVKSIEARLSFDNELGFDLSFAMPDEEKALRLSRMFEMFRVASSVYLSTRLEEQEPSTLNPFFIQPPVIPAEREAAMQTMLEALKIANRKSMVKISHSWPKKEMKKMATMLKRLIALTEQEEAAVAFQKNIFNQNLEGAQKILQTNSKHAQQQDYKELWKQSIDDSLLSAVRNGDVKATRYLLQHGANPEKKHGFYKTRPVHAAAEINNTEQLKLLLNQKVNLEVRDNAGSTPLLLALRNGHSANVDLLLAHGADIEVIDNEGEGVLHYAAQSDDLPLFKRILRQSKIEINRLSKQRASALHVAAGHSYEISKFLINNRAKIDAANSSGRTPLFLACQSNEVDIVYLLLKKKARTNIFDLIDDTPLHIAVEKNNLHLIRLLLKNGAKLNVKNGDGLTPLQLAEEKYHDKAAEVLRKAMKKK